MVPTFIFFHGKPSHNAVNEPNAAISSEITAILQSGNSKSTAVVEKNLKTNQSSAFFGPRENRSSHEFCKGVRGRNASCTLDIHWEKVQTLRYVFKKLLIQLGKFLLYIIWYFSNENHTTDSVPKIDLCRREKINTVPKM